MRKTPLITGEYYHIFNRGVDKRIIFNSPQDPGRFLEGMREFNTIEPIVSLYHNANKNRRSSTPPNVQEGKLVDIIAYCLNPNHYHLILRQVSENGISKFLQRLGTGYTNYFNEKYKRSGALFQGRFKSVYIENNEQLLHVSVYVNLNNKVHKKFDNEADFTVQSSWKEYTVEDVGGFCKKDIILEQFKNKTEYRHFAENTITSIVAKRREKEDEDTTLSSVF